MTRGQERLRGGHSFLQLSQVGLYLGHVLGNVAALRVKQLAELDLGGGKALQLCLQVELEQLLVNCFLDLVVHGGQGPLDVAGIVLDDLVDLRGIESLQLVGVDVLRH